ncbi:3-hydroxyacyl-CoA dehydrogenase family protein, partial [Gemmiger formicilis]|uniref:3-hydroxyacyl-CoA dehydrogenase family protein n=2 Tax=Clostridia TaxID=186801 RepID=UPI003AB12382
MAKAFYTSVGNEPVVLQKEALGFICNRLQMALYREVCNLVMSGVCTVEDADKAVTFGPGIRWGIMGPSLVFELGGGAGGVSGLMNHLNDSISLWLGDMADWKEFPQDWAKVAQEGVNAELANRSPETGNTHQSLEEYRDAMLIQLLKLHIVISLVAFVSGSAYGIFFAANAPNAASVTVREAVETLTAEYRDRLEEIS